MQHSKSLPRDRSMGGGVGLFYPPGHKVRTGKVMLSAPLEPMTILGIWGLIFTRGDP
jgi:hypothetical protein